MSKDLIATELPSGESSTKCSAYFDLVGKTYGELTILSIDEMTRSARCSCSCGREKTTLIKLLRGGKVRSCGCLRERAKIKHGCSFEGKKTKEYRAWRGIKERTCNENNKGYAGYGGRGINLCQEWRESFAAFFAHIGPAPSPKHSVDRINTLNGYEPGNVRWATALEQARNSRRNVLNMDLARQIRAARKEGVKPGRIARSINVMVENVYGVLRGRCWVES